jgi:hypothetical protein
MAHFIPCKETITSEETAQLFMNNIFRLHGLPTTIISDRGPQFTANFWKHLWKTLGTTLSMSTAYHPQTDGQTERTNQTLEQYLRCFLNYQQDDWHELLPLCEFAYNNSIHSATQTTPFLANYGFHPRSDHLETTESNVPTVTTHLENIARMNKLLDLTLKEAAENAKRFADRKRLDVTFEEGDKVWLLRRNLKTARPMEKLDYRKIGPYTVKRQINAVAYELDLPNDLRIHPVFHVSLLEKYHRNTIPNRVVPPPLPVILNNEPEYEVEQILDSRLRFGKLQYLIKWKGYSVNDNSWEPKDNVLGSSDLVAEFHRLYPDKPRKEGKQPRRTRGGV